MEDFWLLLTIILAILVVLGIVAGLADVIVVYRDYDDLGIVFLMTVSSLGTLFLVLFFGENGGWFKPVIFLLGAATFIGLLVFISFRTWKDNPNLLMPLALLTKLALGTIFVFYLFDLLSPSGKTQNTRARSRASALAMLTVLTPLVLVLVKTKSGILSPKQVFNSFQKGRLKL
jgi:hypothetical protein